MSVTVIRITHEDIAEILTEALGRTIRYVRITDEEYRQWWKAKDVPDEAAEAWFEINRYLRTDDCSPVTSKVEKITGNPPILVKQFCRDYVSALPTDQKAMTQFPGECTRKSNELIV